MTIWYVTDMDRVDVSKHSTYANAKNRVYMRVGHYLDIERIKAGFYMLTSKDEYTSRRVYIIREGTKYTGFDDIWSND